MKLRGLRVVDLSVFLPGPYMTMAMADHGAEIIKIEAPGDGDPGRHIGQASGGSTVFFRNMNRGKQSVVLDLKSDAGRAKHAVRFAEMIDADFAIMHKTRPSHDTVSVTEVTGRVRGKVAIIGDDITTTGGTLIAGAQALREHGATDIWIFVTHALLSAEGLRRLDEAGFAGIVVTDTVPIDPIAKPENMTVLTVAPLLAETIMNVFADDSVSAIFGGENQLF